MMAACFLAFNLLAAHEVLFKLTPLCWNLGLLIWDLTIEDIPKSYCPKFSWHTNDIMTPKASSVWECGPQRNGNSEQS